MANLGLLLVNVLWFGVLLLIVMVMIVVYMLYIVLKVEVKVKDEVERRCHEVEEVVVVKLVFVVMISYEFCTLISAIMVGVDWLCSDVLDVKLKVQV